MAATKKPVFEKNLSALEGVVEQLESGQLTLDEAMKAFEKGIALTRDCQESLAKAEQKVQVLINNQGEESLQPLANQGDE